MWSPIQIHHAQRHTMVRAASVVGVHCHQIHCPSTRTCRCATVVRGEGGKGLRGGIRPGDLSLDSPGPALHSHEPPPPPPGIGFLGCAPRGQNTMEDANRKQVNGAGFTVRLSCRAAARTNLLSTAGDSKSWLFYHAIHPVSSTMPLWWRRISNQAVGDLVDGPCVSCTLYGPLDSSLISGEFPTPCCFSQNTHHSAVGRMLHSLIVHAHTRQRKYASCAIRGQVQ